MKGLKEALCKLFSKLWWYLNDVITLATFRQARGPLEQTQKWEKLLECNERHSEM